MATAAARWWPSTPANGEILALVSKPTFDPNLFVEGIDVDNWTALNESIDKPLLNRALRGTYPPGSTYKPFMALAALQLGKRSPSMVMNDPGFYTFARPHLPAAMKVAWAGWTCTAPSSFRATPTSTRWPWTWAWTPSTTS